MATVNQKIQGMIDMLTQAQQHLKNGDEIGQNMQTQSGFLSQIELIQQQIHGAHEEVNKYLDANIFKKKFIEDVFPILCTCGRCTSRATLNFKKLCFSWNELAKTCTTLKIETPAGKTTWERIQVKRVCEYKPKKITPPLDEFME